MCIYIYTYYFSILNEKLVTSILNLGCSCINKYIYIYIYSIFYNKNWSLHFWISDVAVSMCIYIIYIYVICFSGLKEKLVTSILNLGCSCISIHLKVLQHFSTLKQKLVTSILNLRCSCINMYIYIYNNINIYIYIHILSVFQKKNWSLQFWISDVAVSICICIFQYFKRNTGHFNSESRM